MEKNLEVPVLPKMVMCGDHPSFTKTELNAKESAEEKEVLPKPSTTVQSAAESCRAEGQPPTRQRVSDRALRPRHRDRGNYVAMAARADVTRPHNGSLMQAALGSARWPPYVVLVWVCALLATHALHGVVGCLERALPTLRKLCQYLRSRASSGWHGDRGSLCPGLLAALAAIAYTVYFALYVVYSAALWSIEPLAFDDGKSEMGAIVTDYDDGSKSDHSMM